MMRILSTPILIAMLMATAVGGADAALNFSPPSISISTTGPTTFVMRFFEDDPDRTFTTTEAFFCITVSVGGPGNCAQGSILGRLPANLDRGSTTVRVKAITDVVTVPYSVVRRAVARNVGTILYVRTFNIFNGGGPAPVVVAVPLRLSGGTAASPLTLTRVDIYGDEPERPRARFIALDRETQEFGVVKADITYTGVGLLTGWWEVRMPTDPPARLVDRFPEAALTLAERGQRHVFRRVQRIRVQLTPSGRIVLNGPPYADLPDGIPGVYEVLLKIEVTRDVQAREVLPVPGEAPESYYGAVAAFALPTLEYRVGTRVGALGSREIAARVVYDDSSATPRLGVAWTPIADRPLVVDIVVTDTQTGETRSLIAPARVGVAFLPDRWVAGRRPERFEFEISVLGEDKRPVFADQPTALATPSSR